MWNTDSLKFFSPVTIAKSNDLAYSQRNAPYINVYALVKIIMHHSVQTKF